MTIVCRWWEDMTPHHRHKHSCWWYGQFEKRTILTLSYEMVVTYLQRQLECKLVLRWTQFLAYSDFQVKSSWNPVKNSSCMELTMKYGLVTDLSTASSTSRWNMYHVSFIIPKLCYYILLMYNNLLLFGLYYIFYLKADAISHQHVSA